MDAAPDWLMTFAAYAAAISPAVIAWIGLHHKGLRNGKVTLIALFELTLLIALALAVVYWLTG
jgi:hypothetical protein